jgi:multidrug efflux system membrane fusion protein
MSALQRDAKGGTAVWVVDSRDSTVHLVPVRAGAFAEDSVPICGNLAADAWIVAAGGHLLREGQKVLPVDRENRPVAATPNAKAR